MVTVKFRGEPVKITGNVVNKGEKAPVVSVVGQDLSEVKITQVFCSLFSLLIRLKTAF